MPNIIDSNGIQVQSRDEIVSEIKNGTTDYPGLYSIYGADINVEPNSPDGQLINLIAQAKVDVLEMAQQVYNSFDPDKAIGVQLDSRCAINGVIRHAGTYTLVPILVTVDQALTLEGYDTLPSNPFTIADSAGTQFVLESQHVFSSAGNATLQFRAANLGQVITSPNTITNVVTAQLGVVSVNNPNVATQLGQNEESDYDLRIRRQKSVSLPSRGYFEGLVGALLNVSGVEQAVVLENVTNVTDSRGIPGHSIWCITEGGASADIGEAIYVKRNAGCGMKGSVTQPITQIDGSTFNVLFDRPTDENLYISFDCVAVTGSVDPTYIRAQLFQLLSYGIGQAADSSAIVALVKQIAPNVSVNSEGVSNDDVTYVSLLDTTAVNYRFVIDPTRIIINGAHP